MTPTNRLVMRLMVASMTLAGCSQPIKAQLLPTAEIEPSPTLAPSATLADEPTATEAVVTATPTLQLNPAATFSAPLIARKPTGQEILFFLTNVFPDDPAIPDFVESADLTYKDLNNDGEADLVYWYDELLLEIAYNDVNGDVEADLIVLAPPVVYMLLWTDEGYTVPFRLATSFLRGGPSSSVQFEDWTGDGIFEVVFDNSVMTGGTGLFIWNTTRYIIQCRFEHCDVVWRGRLSDYTRDVNVGGMAHYHADMGLTVDEAGTIVLRYLFRGFSIYTDGSFDNPAVFRIEDPRALNVTTSTLSLYSWTGSTFELTSEQVVSLPYTVASQASLTATNPAGVIATISVRSDRFPEVYSYENDICQLAVAGSAVGLPFGCKQNFTTVVWKDLTGDGRAEVVVIALSGGHDPDGNVLSDGACVHQHLLAYQWDGVKLAELANITGCVVRDDLYGVRLEDYDQDGQPEILAASNSEHTLDQIYKWNGSRFVFWDDVPGQ